MASAARVTETEDLIAYACAAERRKGIERAVLRWCARRGREDWIAQTISTGCPWPFGVALERDALDALVTLLRTLLVCAQGPAPVFEPVTPPGRRRRANGRSTPPTPPRPRLVRVK